MATKIFVLTHKPFTPPADPVYTPLQVGAALHPSLGYEGDHTGDQISAKNNRYGELTGVYWIWKNCRFSGNIGVCHYRRLFVKEGLIPLSEADYEQILSEYDCITSSSMQAKKSYYSFYTGEHDPKQLTLLEEAVSVLDPETLPLYREAMEGTSFYFGNLCVMKRDEFDRYCEWLFSLLSYVEERLDVSGYDEYHGRVFGFLSEQLLLTWIRKRGLRPYECRIGLMGDKAETTEFKLAMEQLVKTDQIEEAYRMFYEILKIRPDLIREQSDLSGDLLAIDHILFTILEEKKQGLPGLLSYSCLLPELIRHYKKTERYLTGKEGDPKEAEAYFQKTGVTEVLKSVIRSSFAIE